ncbi:MAG TPA: PQQ-binding-like beta-propeller repeat protein, partial [Candidatus Ozemobacteraceae bacterium]|nr:PQQ-binding-like beta-propeller repeat protein [Candidatus Ozemobacteraceae bacterium]
DERGQTLFARDHQSGFRTISVSGSLEILAVGDQGFAYLISPNGDLVWKKRPAQALFGLISGSGRFLALVSREPTVVLADRNGAVKWVYRNLLATPGALDIAHDGQTVVFACRDERGEGLAAVGFNGKPYDAFMGIDPLQDLSLHPSGDSLVAVDKGKGIYCLNCIKSFGIWKGALNQTFHGVSFAGDVQTTLLYAKDGLITLLDGKGQPLWEHRFPHPLLRACLSQDARQIFYASPEGRVGCLASRASRDLSRLEFVEIAPTALAGETSASPAPIAWKKLWQFDLEPPSPGDKPRFTSWTGPDQVDYLLLWTGRNSLLCLNDDGEEVWKLSIPGGIKDLAVDPDADLIIGVTGQAVLAYSLDGTQKFKFFGPFTRAGVFNSGAFILMTENGQIRVYSSSGQASHLVPLPAKANNLLVNDDLAFACSPTHVFYIDDRGTLRGQTPLEKPPVVRQIMPFGTPRLSLLGLQNGDFFQLNQDGTEAAHGSTGVAPACLSCHAGEDVLFFAPEVRTEIVIQQNRANKRFRVAVPQRVRSLHPHPRGCVAVTELDELMLITTQGQTALKQSIPDRVLDLAAHASGDLLFILSEGSLAAYAPPDRAARPSSTTRFLEI